MHTRTATRTRTSVKTYLAVGAIGGASFAAAMFYSASAQPAILAMTLNPAASGATIVDGQNDVIALELKVAAKRDAVTVTGITFDVVGDTDGDLSTVQNDLVVADYIESCSLYQATNLLDGPESVVGNQLTFSDVRATIPQNAIANARLECNFANGSSAHATPYAFSFSTTDALLEAEDSDGDSLTAQQIIAGLRDGGVNVRSSQFVTMQEHGGIDIVLNPATPSADIVLPETDREIGQWSATADIEDIFFETLTFNLQDAAAARSIETATLTLVSDVIMSSTVPLNNGVARFSNLVETVEAGETVTLSLSVHTADSAQNAAGSSVSGDQIQFALDATSPQSFSAIGMTSGYNFTEATAGIASSSTQTFVYRDSEPTVTFSPVSPSGQRTVGRGEMLRFNISASTYHVDISQLTFKLNATDGANTNWNQCDTNGVNVTAAADFDLYDVDDMVSGPIDTADANWTLLKTSGAVCDTTNEDLGYVRLTFPTVEFIPEGDTRTFALYFDSTGASSSQDDSVRFDIAGPNGAADAIAWHDYASLTDINGLLVRNLPVSGNTLFY